MVKECTKPLASRMQMAWLWKYQRGPSLAASSGCAAVNRGTNQKYEFVAVILQNLQKWLRKPNMTEIPLVHSRCPDSMPSNCPWFRKGSLRGQRTSNYCNSWLGKYKFTPIWQSTENFFPSFLPAVLSSHLLRPMNPVVHVFLLVLSWSCLDLSFLFPLVLFLLFVPFFILFLCLFVFFSGLFFL